MGKLVIPKQHGAWAMLLIPFLFGVFLGQPKWGHLLLFIGWFFLYIGSYAFLNALKTKKDREKFFKFAFIYFLIALLAMLFPLAINIKLLYFGLIMIPFFFINMYFSKTKNERVFVNDIVAVFVFCIGGLASYYYGKETIDQTALQLFGLSFLYFLGTIFYVKTMIREKNNIRYKYFSWGYHLGLIPFFFVIQSPMLLIAYLPCIIRAIVLYGKNLAIIKIGILESANSIFFFLAVIFILM